MVGSLTHCQGFRAAAVADERTVCSVGIDAEPAEPLPDGLLEQVAAPGDGPALHAVCATYPGVPWSRLLFVAKEAVYKMWHPVTDTWLDFADIRVARWHVDRAEEGSHSVAGCAAPRFLGGFEWAITSHGPLFLTRGVGRWLVRDGIMLATVVVVRSGARYVSQEDSEGQREEDREVGGVRHCAQLLLQPNGRETTE